ncbi:MAG: SMC-Scp complex subunit ScpB [Alphaproteobacteria bacterium]|jgi:segregation and condensation protein B|nr:SMC-Scp complex subunit ScpB [Alphaproteobacteria bacterium]
MERPHDQRAGDLRLLEALLFAAERPLTAADIARHLPEGANAPALIAALAQDYAGRGVEVVERGGAWAFRTAPDLAEALATAREAEKPVPRAALETLAVIAYHQPVTRAEIEAIRGVSTQRATLAPLIEAGWVKPGRRRPTPGRPTTWVTTWAFLDHFGLASLADLPEAEEMRAAGLVVGPDAPDLFAAAAPPPAEEEAQEV